MQIVSSVTFEELLTAINMEDGGSWRENGAGFLYLVMLKGKKIHTANKMGCVICRGRDCEINGRIHNAKVGD